MIDRQRCADCGQPIRAEEVPEGSSFCSDCLSDISEESDESEDYPEFEGPGPYPFD